MYEYSAKLVKTVDGDTVDLTVDLGFNIHKTDRFRLHGINTPEMHDKDPAVRAKAELAKKELDAMLLGKDLLIKTYKDDQDKYGRYLAQIWVGTTCVNDVMVQRGLAVVYLP